MGDVELVLYKDKTVRHRLRPELVYIHVIVNCFLYVCVCIWKYELGQELTSASMCMCRKIPVYMNI